MNIQRIFQTTLFIVFCASSSSSWAGGMTAFFGPNDRSLPEVLPHLENKALIVEFRDVQRSDIGKDVALVLWREILNAISDQKGAGVIVAQRTEDQPIIDMEKGEYHLAARRIAESQNTWASVWGSVDVVRDKLFIEGYLSLLPEAVQIKPLLQFYVMGEAVPELSTPMPRSLFSFRLEALEKDSLFKRTVVTRRSARLYLQPDVQSAVVKTLPAKQALQMLGMQNGWLTVEGDEGTHGFLKMGEDSPVDIPPLKIEGRGNRIRLRSTPDTGRDENILVTLNLSGSYKVLDQKYIPGQGSWYQIDYNSRKAWVAAWLVDAQYSVTWVELVAGLLRFQANNYVRAAGHFQRYIDLSQGRERNVNLAAAYQLLGAAQMRQGFAQWQDAQASFEASTRLTPYDPNAYAIQALASLNGPINDALGELDQSLDLDKTNGRARALLSVLLGISEGHGPVAAERILGINSEARRQLKTLEKEYDITFTDQF